MLESKSSTTNNLHLPEMLKLTAQIKFNNKSVIDINL